MKKKYIWLIGTLSVAAIGIVTAWIKSSYDKPTVNQHNTAGTVGASVVIPGDSNKTTISPTTITGDHAKTAISNNQSGGQTGVDIYNLNVILLPGFTGKGSRNHPAGGCTYHVDTVRKAIQFEPQSGQWDTPMVAIPLNEKDAVAPRFARQAGGSPAIDPAIQVINGDSVFTQSSASAPSKATSGYQLDYQTLPSQLYFGSRGGPLYKLTLKEK